MNKQLIVLVGSTAVGKTEMAIKLAKELDTEIVSADSRQFYRELRIGVASPSQEERAMVKHHFVGNISVCDSYNAATYSSQAIEVINQLFLTHQRVILTGGSGMYIKAVCEGIDFIPDSVPHIRAELNNIFIQGGIEPLQEELQEKDPFYWAKVDKNNHIRIIRALEVCRSTGKPFSSFRTGKKIKHSFDIIKKGLCRSREDLVNRINIRVDAMIANGLLEEARRLYPFKELQALNTVGYSELFEYFDGKVSLKDAIEQIKINTRQYSRRQMTWFRKDKEINWTNLEP
jgi:tRNA dimethylallyltransferase